MRGGRGEPEAKCYSEYAACRRTYSCCLWSQVLAEKRNVGRQDGPPHLVVVVPLHAGVVVQSSLRLLLSGEAPVKCQTETGTLCFALSCPRSKQRWHFVTADAGKREHLSQYVLQ